MRGGLGARQTLSNRLASVIPKTFHRIWLGPDPLPAAFERFGESWTQHHPGWEMRLWTERDLSELRVPKAYEGARHDSERSNILRYEVLRAFGGVYLDTDFECLKPIDPLLEGLDFFVGQSAPGRIGSAIIGAVPTHPIMEQAVREARPREGEAYDKAGTGPLFLAGVIEQHPEPTVFDPAVLYPRTAEERAGAFAVHHPTRSWMTREEMNERINSLQQTVHRLRGRVAKRDARIEGMKAALKSAQKRIKDLERGRTTPARSLLGLAAAPARRLRRRL